MRHFQPWSSLRTQLQLKVVRTALLIGFIASVLGYFFALHNAMHQARDSLQQSLTSLTYTAAIAAFTADQNLAEDALKGVLSNPLVCRAHIASLDGRLSLTRGMVAHASKDCRPGPDLWLDSPFNAGSHVGTFNAELYLPAVQLHALQTTFNEFIGLLFLLLGSTWASWRATNGLLTKPLLNLAQSVHALQPGQNVQLITPASHQRNELGVLIKDINGLLGMVVQTIDDERRIRQQMESLQQQYQAIFEQARTGICLIDAEGHCTLANPSTARVLQMPLPCDGPFCPYGDWLELTFKEPDRFRDLLLQTLQNIRTTAIDLPLLAVPPGKIQPWVNITISSHQSLQGSLLECILVDISERKRVEEETRYQAEHDPLTHLHNRNSGMRLLESTFCTSLRPSALLLIDLDRFKWINDHYGHQAGDQALIHVARKLSSAARSADIVIRLGGDEFLLGLLDIGNLPSLYRIINRIISEVTQPFPLSPEQQEHVGVSIGIALYPEAGADLVSLMGYADIAMYRVKQAGRGGYCVFNGSSYSDVVRTATADSSH